MRVHVRVCAAPDYADGRVVSFSLHCAIPAVPFLSKVLACFIITPYEEQNHKA